MKKAIFTLKEDQELWGNFREGNMQAFKQIYKDYYPLLLDYGRKIKRHDEFIKDCIQELFCDLLKHRDSLGHTDNILYYLFASLRRKIFRKLQYDLSFRIEENFYINNKLQLAEYSSEDTLINNEDMQLRKRLLRTMIDNLPPQQKKALLLKFYLNCDYTELAEIMKLNIQSVRNHIHRAVSTLREQIESNVLY